LYYHALHPYTKSLLSAIPYPDPIYEKKRQRIIFQPKKLTGTEELREINPGHFVYCKEEDVENFLEERGKQPLVQEISL
ncbi:MAG TPA: hypothetical protein VFC62_05705, partial [Atopostipes sp.]|nr:hypothetical protein [Atopostipes sp.]